MLRLTKQADYAIVLLTHFAMAAEGAVLSARDLAVESRLPAPIVSKVLKALARGGLLASQRGVNGGYRLARAPHEVTVAEVIAALEGPIAVSACSADLGCAQEPHCAARTPLQRLNLLVLGVLQRVTLAQVLQPSLDRREPDVTTAPTAAATTTTWGAGTPHSDPEPGTPTTPVGARE